MARYIDADLLDKDVIRYADRKHFYGNIEEANIILKTRQIISEAPTVDAEVVRHGKWIHDTNNLFGCSECMERDTMSFRRGLKNYCPNCGAKMDGEHNDIQRV